MCPVVTPDFSQSYKPLTPGAYVCRIKAAELKQGRNHGTNYIRWELETEHGHVVHYGTPIDGRGAGMFKRFIHVAGDEQYESGPYDTGNILGHRVLCEIEDETYLSQGQERVRSRVKEVRKYDPDFNEADLPF